MLLVHLWLAYFACLEKHQPSFEVWWPCSVFLQEQQLLSVVGSPAPSAVAVVIVSPSYLAS